jgi:hypothetical protein
MNVDQNEETQNRKNILQKVMFCKRAKFGV